MSYFKIGFRYLARRKFRTILTIVAILLGTSIFMGTSVASDSIRASLNYQVTKQFGYTDIIIVNEFSPNTNSFSLTAVRNELENLTGIQIEWSYQMREGRSVTPYPNTSTIFSYWWQFVGLNASNPTESKFGSVKINSTINETLTTIEAMLTYPLIDNSCVITKYVADLCNLSVGEILYVYPWQPWAGIDWPNSSTWVQLTIVGIIEDQGKSFSWFGSPPWIDIWEVRPIEYAVFVDIDVAQKYIFNGYPDRINNILIHAPNIQAIDSTIDIIIDLFNKSSDPLINSTDFYGFNLKSFFASQVSDMFNFFTTALALFSAIALLICAILIKNLIEVTKEEQMEEIGIMRAIGISKIGIFRIYLSQISIISVIGSFLGLLLGYFISNLFLGPLRYVSLAFNPQLGSVVGSDFEIIIVVTNLSLILSLGIGISISMVFGMIPAVSAANVDVLKALNPRLMEEK